MLGSPLVLTAATPHVRPLYSASHPVFPCANRLEQAALHIYVSRLAHVHTALGTFRSGSSHNSSLSRRRRNIFEATGMLDSFNPQAPQLPRISSRRQTPLHEHNLCQLLSETQCALFMYLLALRCAEQLL